MVGQAVAKEWNQEGLPTDKFSIENGTIVKKAN